MPASLAMAPLETLEAASLAGPSPGSFILSLRDAGRCRNLPIKPNTSHRTLHHLVGVTSGLPPVVATFYVRMVASDTEVPLLYEVPLLLVEQGAQVSGWTMAQSAAMSITVHLCSAAAARIWSVPLPRIGSRS